MAEVDPLRARQELAYQVMRAHREHSERVQVVFREATEKWAEAIRELARYWQAVAAGIAAMCTMMKDEEVADDQQDLARWEGEGGSLTLERG